MTPTPLAALFIAAAASLALFVGPLIAGFAVVCVIAATVVDALMARKAPDTVRRCATILSRGRPEPITVTVSGTAVVDIRQPAPPDVLVADTRSRGTLDTTFTARRRGRHVLPAPAVRRFGPFGLGAWNHARCGDDGEVLVYPDLVVARTLALAVRRGRFRESGRMSRGPLGLGTDFESIREYVPDDDVRQVNWLATARVGRPMSNQLRVEQDRDVICVIDAGRLMTAPLREPSRPADELTRMDAAVDAATAVAFVADVVGDRCGHIAFDTEVRGHLRPRRSGGEAVVRSIFDLEARSVDSDYELAFRNVGEAKRAFVLVLTDLLDESAARPLVDAIPVLARRHHVVVAGARDPDLEAIMRKYPNSAADVYASAVALDVIRAREAAVRRIRSVGAEVVEAGPRELPAACVGAYLRAKSRARI